jgi:hypothetical protein
LEVTEMGVPGYLAVMARQVPPADAATLESLQAQRCDLLSDPQVEQVVADCASYFARRPYLRWFQPLDAVVRAGLGASYFDGSACHLDLIQWATDPVWGQIADPRLRQMLLDDGVPHLRAHLRQGMLRVVLLNGRTVVDQAERAPTCTAPPAQPAASG